MNDMPQIGIEGGSGNLKLNEFIYNKIKELKEIGLYKDVELLSAVDVQLSRNSAMEDFITKDSDMEKECIEVTSFGTLTNEYQSGSKIRIDVLKKRKKKYDTIRYHVVYTE